MSAPAKTLPDTNVLLRYLLRDNPGQFAEAEQFFEAVRRGRRKAIIREAVLVECLYVLTKFYKVPRGEAAGIMKELLLYKGVANADVDVLIAALELFASSTLDPVDCVLAALARHGEGELFTFDQALSKAVLDR